MKETYRYDWVRNPYGRNRFHRDEWNFYKTLVVDGKDVGSVNIGFVTYFGDRHVRKDRPSPVIGELFGGCIYDLNEPGTGESNWCTVYTVKEAKRWCEEQVGATKDQVTSFG